MLRIALANVARTPARSARVSRQVLRPVFVRYESSGKPDPEALKAAHKTNDALQRDWQSPLLTYEQVKPKTEHPSSVSFSRPVCFPRANHQPGCISYRRARTERSDTGIHPFCRQPPTFCACNFAGP